MRTRLFGLRGMKGPIPLELVILASVTELKYRMNEYVSLKVSVRDNNTPEPSPILNEINLL